MILREARPGSHVEMIVLAAGDGGCVGLDLASGAFVRALWPTPEPPLDDSLRDLVRLLPGGAGQGTAGGDGSAPAGADDEASWGLDSESGAAADPDEPGAASGAAPALVDRGGQGQGAAQGSGVVLAPPLDESRAIPGMLHPRRVVRAEIAPHAGPKDPSRPEAVAVVVKPEPLKGRLSSRQIGHHLERVKDLGRGPVLGFAGPATPLWGLSGTRPSVALVELKDGLVLVQREREEQLVRARFTSGGLDHELPVMDPRVVAVAQAANRNRLGGRGLQRRLGWTPRWLVVALTGAREGYCYRVVAGVLP